MMSDEMMIAADSNYCCVFNNNEEQFSLSATRMILVCRRLCRQGSFAKLGIRVASLSGATNDYESLVRSAPSSSSSSIPSCSNRTTASADIGKEASIRSVSDRAVENQSIEEVGENASSSKKRIAEKETVDGNAVAYDYQLLKDSMDAVFVEGVQGICGVKFDKFIKEWLHHCGVSNISVFVRIAGKKSKGDSFKHLKRNLPAVARRLDSLSLQKWNYLRLSWVIYGMQCLDEDDSGYIDIIKIMTRILNELEKKRALIIYPQSIAMMLLGLQNNKFKCKESLQLVAAIGQVTPKCGDKFTAQNVGNALYGIQNLNCTHPETLVLLSALTPQLRDSCDILSSQEVGNSLYGLKSMNCDSPHVLALLSILTPKVTKCNQVFTQMSAAIALHGLQGMGSERREVRDLLKAFAPKVMNSLDSWKPQQIANSMHGLQGMSSKHPEVLEILSAITAKVNSGIGKFKAHDVGYTLYSLRNMSSDAKEVRMLLSALTMKYRDCTETLTAQDFNNALQGLQNMDNDLPEVAVLLSVLKSKCLAVEQPSEESI
jgi:hypothetical protein